MNETCSKIIALLFNKTTLAYMVVGLLAIYLRFWFNQSEYSPKSIKETIDKNGERQQLQAQTSLTRDSLIWLKVNEISHDQYLMKMQIDTLANHQMPEVRNNLKLMKQMSGLMLNNNMRPTSHIIQPMPPITRIEQPETSYEQTMNMLNEIELSMKADTIKKNVNSPDIKPI